MRIINANCAIRDIGNIPLIIIILTQVVRHYL
jgi:hypothetical protein